MDSARIPPEGFLSDLPTKKNGSTAERTTEEREDSEDAPQSFGRYQVIRHLASGGMGAVFLAHDGVLQREVAVKTVRPLPGKLGKEFSARFLNEARCVASLKHPNIVPLFDLGLEGETPYLVMEVVEGPSLGAKIKTSQLTSREVRTVGIQISNALAEAHQAGIVHRDVKPGNILQAGEGSWKLVDFGVAHVPDSSITTVGDFLGTPAYAAPESLEGNGFSAASDVYGLAATLYHVLAGNPPHGMGNAVKVALRASSERPVSLGTINPNLPVDLVQLIDLCLSRDPAVRPSAQALAEQLASARPDTLDGLPEGVPTPPPPVDGEADTFYATGEAPVTGGSPSIGPSMGPSIGHGQPPGHGQRRALPRLAVGAVAVLALMLVLVLVILPDESNTETLSPPESPKNIASSSAANEKTTSARKDIKGPAKTPRSSATRAPATETEKPATALASKVGEPEPGLVGLEEVQQLLARKQNTAAARSLDKLRADYPASAYLAFLQGSLYMDKRFWKDGFEAYRSAIGNDPRYREHPRIISDGVRALYSKSQPWRGTRFLKESIGSPARPALESALGDAANPKIRHRISALLKQLP